MQKPLSFRSGARGGWGWVCTVYTGSIVSSHASKRFHRLGHQVPMTCPLRIVPTGRILRVLAQLFHHEVSGNSTVNPMELAGSLPLKWE